MPTVADRSSTLPTPGSMRQRVRGYSRIGRRRPGPRRMGSYEKDGGGAGHEPAPDRRRHRTPAQDRRAISGPLNRVTRGQSRLPGASQPGWSAPLAAVTAALPKLIVRVRFSSPAPRVQARLKVPGESGLGSAGHGRSRTGRSCPWPTEPLGGRPGGAFGCHGSHEDRAEQPVGLGRHGDLHTCAHSHSLTH